jgi:hypothetical protein
MNTPIDENHQRINMKNDKQAVLKEISSEK